MDEEEKGIEMLRSLKEGQRVKAVQRIAFPDFGKDEHIHAEEGDEGIVECVDDEMCELGPAITVRFDKSGSATVVGYEEIAPT